MAKNVEKVYVLLGFLVRQARLKKNMSTATLADKLDMSESSTRSIETGKQRIPFHTAIKLAKIFNIDLNSIKEA